MGREIGRSGLMDVCETEVATGIMAAGMSVHSYDGICVSSSELILKSRERRRRRRGEG